MILLLRKVNSSKKLLRSTTLAVLEPSKFCELDLVLVKSELVRRIAPFNDFDSLRTVGTLVQDKGFQNFGQVA